jgi:hypothetical protein
MEHLPVDGLAGKQAADRLKASHSGYATRDRAKRALATDLCRTRPARDRRTTALTMSNERLGSTFLRYGSIRDALLGKRDSAIGANFTASTEIVGTGRLVSQSAASFFR